MPSFIQRIFAIPNFTQQAYRYGISFACIGVLLNWFGVAQVQMAPVRYIGIGLVILGSLLIITAMCRWMFTPATNHNLENELNSVNVDELRPLQVITVPIDMNQSINRSSLPFNKPPDYYLVADKPPTYEEAMSMRPEIAVISDSHDITQASGLSINSDSQGTSQTSDIAIISDSQDTTQTSEVATNCDSQDTTQTSEIAINSDFQDTTQTSEITINSDSQSSSAIEADTHNLERSDATLNQETEMLMPVQASVAASQSYCNESPHYSSAAQSLSASLENVGQGTSNNGTAAFVSSNSSS